MIDLDASAAILGKDFALMPTWAKDGEELSDAGRFAFELLERLLHAGAAENFLLRYAMLNTTHFNGGEYEDPQTLAECLENPNHTFGPVGTYP